MRWVHSRTMLGDCLHKVLASSNLRRSLQEVVTPCLVSVVFLSNARGIDNRYSG